MKIADLKKMVDAEYEKDPNRQTPIITCDGWLRFGEWVETDPPSRENNYKRDGYWDAQEFILHLPQEAKHWQ